MAISLPEGISLATSAAALVVVLFRGGWRMGNASRQLDELNAATARLSGTVERLDHHVTRIEARCPLCKEDPQ